MVLAAFRYVVPADISTRAGKWEKKKFLVGTRMRTCLVIFLASLDLVCFLPFSRTVSREARQIHTEPAKLMNVCKLFRAVSWLTKQSVLSAWVQSVSWSPNE